MPEEEFQYGDYDLEEDVTVVPASDALAYPDVSVQDEEPATGPRALGFVNVFGKSPAEAIATARLWSQQRRWVGVGMCLATVRQYYGVPSGYPTAASSWSAANHKHFASSGIDVPRGAPVWWTGGSSGAGHVAISVGGGVCLSTDWKEPGHIDYAHIDDITNNWGLNFKGWTREVNGVVVWLPVPPKTTVALHNLKPGSRDKDVLQVKKALHNKGYTGFLVTSDKYGHGIQKAYAKFQTRLGYSGSAANGIPGKISLQKLGFRVIP